MNESEEKQGEPEKLDEPQDASKVNCGSLISQVNEGAEGQTPFHEDLKNLLKDLIDFRYSTLYGEDSHSTETSDDMEDEGNETWQNFKLDAIENEVKFFEDEEGEVDHQEFSDSLDLDAMNEESQEFSNDLDVLEIIENRVSTQCLYAKDCRVISLIITIILICTTLAVIMYHINNKRPLAKPHAENNLEPSAKHVQNEQLQLQSKDTIIDIYLTEGKTYKEVEINWHKNNRDQRSDVQMKAGRRKRKKLFGCVKELHHSYTFNPLLGDVKERYGDFSMLYSGSWKLEKPNQWVKDGEFDLTITNLKDKTKTVHYGTWKEGIGILEA